jgi:hypothetical protein
MHIVYFKVHYHFEWGYPYREVKFPWCFPLGFSKVMRAARFAMMDIESRIEDTGLMDPIAVPLPNARCVADQSGRQQV